MKHLFSLFFTIQVVLLSAQSVVSFNGWTLPGMGALSVSTDLVPTSQYAVTYVWKIKKAPHTWTFYSNSNAIAAMFPFHGTYKVYAIVQYVRRSTGTVVSSQITNTLTINLTP